MTALSPGNLLNVGQALPHGAMQSTASLSAWNQALPVLVSIILHTGLIVIAMVHDFSPADMAAEPLFRKGQTASAAGVNVRLVKVTLQGDGFNRGRVRIEPLDAAQPPPPSPVVEHAKSPQPVREPVPMETGHALIDPARAGSVDQAGPILPVRGIGRSTERSDAGNSPSFTAQPMASAMIRATDQPVPPVPATPPVTASKAPAESMTVTHVTVVPARSAQPLPASPSPTPTLPEAQPIEVAIVLRVPSAESVKASRSNAAKSAPTANESSSASEPQARTSQPAGVDGGAELEDLPTPVYPAEARRRGEQGTVLLEIEMLPDGKVGEIRVIESPGHPRLVQAALAAARRVKLRPAAVARTSAQWIRVPFYFVIR